jgi:hypothetical protein
MWSAAIRLHPAMSTELKSSIFSIFCFGMNGKNEGCRTAPPFDFYASSGLKNWKSTDTGVKRTQIRQFQKSPNILPFVIRILFRGNLSASSVVYMLKN